MATHNPFEEGAKSHSRFEIQIHPSDIQRGVKYLFLSKGQLAALGLAIAAYLVVVGIAAVKAPSVIGGMLSQREYQAQQLTSEQLNLPRLTITQNTLPALGRGSVDGLRRPFLVYFVLQMSPCDPVVFQHPRIVLLTQE